jgi:tetratricopeptide (TPR) repeat protein
LAADVATRVASLNDPSGTDFRVIDANSGQLGGRYVLKVASRGRALTLVSSQNNSIIWSSPVELAQDSPEDFAQAVSVTAQRALSCAADALSYRREQIDQETLKFYLTGCTQYDSAYGTNSIDTTLVKLFGDVVAKAPHFEPAWKKLFTVETDALYGPDRDQLIGTVRAHVHKAEKLGLDFGELYAVKASLLPAGNFEAVLHTLDSGIAKYPKSAILFRSRDLRSRFVGRMNDAANYAGHAVTLDPLSPASLESFALTLAYAGDAQAAYEQLRKAEKLWPNAPNVIRARFSLDLRYGDPREALTLYRKSFVQTNPNPGMVAFIEARIEPTQQNIERAIDVFRTLHRQSPTGISGFVQALGQFGHKDEVIDVLMTYPGGNAIGGDAEVLFRPAMRDVWRDPRSIAAAAHLGLLAYWKKSGQWPDFCFDPLLPYDCKKEAAKYPV